MEREWLYGKTLKELAEVAARYGAKPYAAHQMAEWLYKKEAREIDQMTNLSKELRARMNADHVVGAIGWSDLQTSADGTRKYLFPAFGGGAVESVLIPEGGRATLCISSQVGCRMGCVFCMTGRQGLRANLTAGEILNQIRGVEESADITNVFDKPDEQNKACFDFAMARKGRTKSNVVYMGMGEPLDNAHNVLKSIEILTAEWGYGWSPGRITLSTIGVMPSLKRFLDESRANLTISLHGSDAAQRLSLMPVEAAYPVEKIVKMVAGYDFSHQRRISFGYILFEGLNDTPRDADRVAALLAPLGRCRVNLIPFHEIPESPLKAASRASLEAFRDRLSRKGLIVTIRTSRGQDIDAACGLLSTKGTSENPK